MVKDVRRWSTAKVLVSVGTLVMLAALVSVVLALTLRSHCLSQQTVVHGTDFAASDAACAGYGQAAGVSYVALAVGALTIVAGALAGSAGTRGRARGDAGGGGGAGQALAGTSVPGPRRRSETRSRRASGSVT
ncbi:MAG TPA: hypothetical protein VHD39_05540 [Acidimicrobiales bacterium]|nr:hypothetical protein [Acidimicrobiales bacterium]